MKRVHGTHLTQLGIPITYVFTHLLYHFFAHLFMRFETLTCIYGLLQMLNINGFQEKVIVCLDETTRPKWMTRRYYLLFSLFLLSWPYQCWYHMSTPKKKVYCVKLLGI